MAFRPLDLQEKKIVRALIRNPRFSDNQVAKHTGVPVMTVNRKRKRLEREGLLKYFTSFDTGQEGTGLFPEKQLYVITFVIGITRKDYLEKFERDKRYQGFNASYLSQSYLGEKDGHLALILVLDARTQSELVEEFNGVFVPHLRKAFGENSIQEVTSARITNTLRRHHNYIPLLNMEAGYLKKDWPEGWIFVDEIIEKQ